MISYDPIPVLFSIGNLKIRSWGVMLALAFIVALVFMLKGAKKKKIPEKHIWNVWLLCLIGGIAGARILYVLLNINDYIAKPFEILQIWQGGLASYGGIALAILFVFMYVKKNKLSFADVTDIIAPYLALGFAIARIGCFLNWDDFGIASSLPWAIQVAGDVARHPTQLYLSILDFILFLGLIKINRLKENKTRFTKVPTLAVFLFFYAIIRLAIEPLRVYDTSSYNIISASISIFLLITSSLWMIKKIRKSKKF